MGNCSEIIHRELAHLNKGNHPDGGPPGQQWKNSHDSERHVSDDHPGKGHGSPHKNH